MTTGVFRRKRILRQVLPWNLELSVGQDGVEIPASVEDRRAGDDPGAGPTLVGPNLEQARACRAGPMFADVPDLDPGVEGERQ